MVCKLTKNGDKFTLQLDSTLLARLGIDENTELELRTNGRGVYFEPAESGSHTDDLDAVMQQIEDRYESVFKKLAE